MAIIEERSVIMARMGRNQYLTDEEIANDYQRDVKNVFDALLPFARKEVTEDGGRTR